MPPHSWPSNHLSSMFWPTRRGKTRTAHRNAPQLCRSSHGSSSRHEHEHEHELEHGHGHGHGQDVHRGRYL
ncbi:hypothetical protein LY76DRAFT_684972, partial [Colletotrichum caudatum]